MSAAMDFPLKAKLSTFISSVKHWSDNILSGISTVSCKRRSFITFSYSSVQWFSPVDINVKISLFFPNFLVFHSISIGSANDVTPLMFIRNAFPFLDETGSFKHHAILSFALTLYTEARLLFTFKKSKSHELRGKVQ